MPVSDSTRLIIRPAIFEDAGLILRYIIELAAYENAESSVVADEAQIAKSLFEPGSPAQALICLADETPIGYAIYFYNYSSWQGRKGLYLEDLYISPQYRGCGAGQAILRYLAKTAIEEDCGRLEWSVLDWNTPAIEFYENLDAEAQSEWVKYRLSGTSLEKMSRS